MVPAIMRVAEQINIYVVTADKGRDPGEGFGKRAIQIDQRAKGLLKVNSPFLRNRNTIHEAH